MIRFLSVASFAFLAACQTAPSVSTEEQPGIGATMANFPSIPAPDASVLAAKIRRGEISAEAAVEAYIARIDAYDQQGPKVQSIIALNPNALAEARLMDQEAAAGNFRGRLHGVPVLVKDNIDTEDLPTTAGSLALLNNHTMRDSPIIARLRDEGAIILGKTNLSEWANFRSNDSISGWSAVGGQTRNPHSLDRSPCGSSSGSGAAVAAMFAPLALGTETNGSIMCPAAMNGVYAIKPTVGLLPRTHIVPISSTQDTAGPMARSVADLALALTVMAGSDENDSASADADAKKTDYVAALDRGVDGLRIGVLTSAIGDAPGIKDNFEASIETLRSQGAEIVEIPSFDVPDGMWGDAFFVLQAEFKTTLNEYLASTPASVEVRSLEQLIAFNTKYAERQMALFDQSILESTQETGGIPDPKYAPALAGLREATRTNGIDKLLRENRVDVLMAPSRPPAFLIDVVYSDQYPSTGVGADWLAAIAGYPNMTVPMGDDGNDLPVGISIMSGQWMDATVLRVGQVLSMRRPMLKDPSFSQGLMDGSFKDKTAPWRRSSLRSTLFADDSEVE